MKGSPLQRNFNIGAKSPLEQKVDLAGLDPEYVDKLLEKTDGDKSYPVINKANKRLIRKEILKNVKNLKVGKGLNKTLREEKKLQNEKLRANNTLKEDRLGTWDEDKGFVGGGRDKDRKYYRKFTTNEDGTKSWGPEIKTPKWWSSGKRKRDYIKTMQLRRKGDLPTEGMSHDQMQEYIDAGIDPTTMEPIVRRNEMEGNE